MLAAGIFHRLHHPASHVSSPGRTGATSPQLPSTTDVTPCQHGPSGSRELRVEMGVDVDEARRPARRRLDRPVAGPHLADLDDRSPSIARHRGSRSVPSTIVPPRWRGLGHGKT
jgi:hypothetical protein